MKSASIAFLALGLLAHSRAESATDEATTGAFRALISSTEFPFEQYPDFTPAQIRAALPEALVAIQKSSRVFRVDLNTDGRVDCVIEILLHARNAQYFVLQHLKTGWKIIGQFYGQEFSLLGFGSSHWPRLETMLHAGGGHLVYTTYAFRDGRYQETERREEQIGEGANR
jgi:hypothetical protein